ncbi:phospholipase D-like domain-containing protein [Tunturiibacter empetritectus]|uniref:phospholipase D n=1 Tax=Tunturiibacter lichenicola TaxID=2051959 RepID=A0A852VE17_9BACT|nr:phospholipase D-like domain-containing protein [Edaphobacter lichenicola]NYF88694.1 phosphatidylserine/phosphatidylglycerophosphate/cardiolipin synthase-like enzyme [Edaphobacter lichenicola]
MSRSVIVLPDDSAQPILDAIHGAKESIRVKMFVFSDPTLLQAVMEAHQRGVNVRVMLNPERRDGEKENGQSRIALTDAGIEVLDSNPCFDLTHEKSMVIDDRMAFVESLNWETKNLTETRDYAIVTTHKHEVEEIMECFDADWKREHFNAGEHSHLIWCIGNGRQRLGQLIDEAKESLWLQNERYQDPTIIEHLVRANQRGVKVHIMARPPHKLKKDKLIEGVSGLRVLEDIGVKIHKLKHIKLHAKLLLADDARAIIGSINLAPGSFDSRRELAIEVRDEHIIERLLKTVRHDWENSKRLDLSDAGLLAELGQYDPNVAEDLALETHKGGKKC